MKKIYNSIPGNLIQESSIANEIFLLLDSIEFSKWIEVNETIYDSDFFEKNSNVYVIYLDPCGKIIRLYSTSCEDIVDFMKEYVNYEHGEGVDIAICTMEIDNAVVCNHDGQIYLLSMEGVNLKHRD